MTALYENIRYCDYLRELLSGTRTADQSMRVSNLTLRHFTFTRLPIIFRFFHLGNLCFHLVVIFTYYLTLILYVRHHI